MPLGPDPNILVWKSTATFICALAAAGTVAINGRYPCVPAQVISSTHPVLASSPNPFTRLHPSTSLYTYIVDLNLSRYIFAVSLNLMFSFFEVLATSFSASLIRLSKYARYF